MWKKKKDSGIEEIIELEASPSFSRKRYSVSSSKPTPKPPPPTITLHKAARDGRGSVVQEWMVHFSEVDADQINATDEEGYTAFHYAAKYNHLDILRVLTRKDKKEDTEEERMVKADCKLHTEVGGYTALHLAAYYKHSGGSGSRNKETLKFLVEDLELDVNKKAQYDTYPLHVACSRGNKDAVEVLLSHQDIKTGLRDANKDSILHEACTTDNVELLELLLDKLKEKPQLRAMLASKNDSDHTPLHVAFSYGHPKIASKLLESAENGAYAKIDESNPPLLLACSQEEEKIVIEFLKLDLKLTVCQNDGATILHQVSGRGWTKAAREIIHKDKESSLLNKEDNCGRTPLHYAVANNRCEMINLLMQENADVDALDRDERTPLLVAASKGFVNAFAKLLEKADVTRVDIDGKNAVFLAAEADQRSILVTASGKDPTLSAGLFSQVDMAGNTPLHAAAAHGSANTLQTLLEQNVNVNARNFCKKTPLHLAAENGHNGFVKRLLVDPAMDEEGSSDEEGDANAVDAASNGHFTVSFTAEENARTVNISAEDDDSNTALHLAARRGHYCVARTLLKKEADIRARNHVLWTPLDCAAYEGHQQVVELLIEKEAEVDSKDKSRETPLHLAAKRGHTKVVQTLLKHKADLAARNTQGANALDLAIENGHVDVAMAIVKGADWKKAMRNTTKSLQGEQTTPMRKLIKKMPEVALEVLNRCTATNQIRPDHEDYTVTFDYEFLEDFRNDPGAVDDKLEQPIEDRIAQRIRDCYSYLRPSHIVTRLVNKVTSEKRKEDYSTDWGPAVFNRTTHPLNIMVESTQTKLLDHPLVSRLIAFKWSRAWPFYLANLVFYMVFLVCLTVFALLLPNPQSDLCTFDNASAIVEECLMGTNATNYECGECNGNRNFLYAAGAFVVFCVAVRLFMEFFQFLQLPLSYFFSYENWLELILYVLVLIFMSALGRTCVCPTAWQWQIGALAVFLAWIHLSIFIRKLPLFGLYIVMFENIVWTFVKIAIPALLLVLAFSMAFYMTFFVPGPLFAASAFATPGLSIIRAMTMAVGEVDFETIFRLTSGGVSSPGDVPTPIPYPVSFLLWIFFLILMPILLMNLLTSLAVDDVGQIRQHAEHRKLELQIELVLNTEEAFQVIRWLFVREKEKITPNKHSHNLRKVRSVLITGVDENFTADNIVKTLNKTPSEPIEYVLQHSASVLDKIEKLSADVKSLHRKNRHIEMILKKVAEKTGVSKEDLEEETDEDDFV